jgi:hypothetical protein
MRGGRYAYKELYRREERRDLERGILLVHAFHARSPQQLHIKVTLFFGADH